MSDVRNITTPCYAFGAGLIGGGVLSLMLGMAGGSNLLIAGGVLTGVGVSLLGVGIYFECLKEKQEALEKDRVDRGNAQESRFNPHEYL